MKRVLLLLTVTFSLLISSCGMFETPTITFTFVNSTAARTIDVTPIAGEDWTGFTMAIGETRTVESQNSNLLFTFTSTTVGAQRVDTFRTFTFVDP